MMFYFNRRKDPASDALNADLIAARPIISQLSREFIPVNILDEDNEEFSQGKYRPDGDYVPRIIFADPSGEILEHSKNPNAPSSTEYLYRTADEVIEQMRLVLLRYQDRTPLADLDKDL